MKKRIVSMMLAAMVALSVVGCGSKTLSNDYVTVKQYKGLEVAQVEKVEVTDEQVEQSVQANLNAAAEKEPIKDRAAEKGDWVNIDYTGYIDDVAFEGQGLGCSPIKVARELGSERRETVRSLSIVGFCIAKRRNGLRITLMVLSIWYLNIYGKRRANRFPLIFS